MKLRDAFAYIDLEIADLAEYDGDEGQGAIDTDLKLKSAMQGAVDAGAILVDFEACELGDGDRPVGAYFVVSLNGHRFEIRVWSEGAGYEVEDTGSGKSYLVERDYTKDMVRTLQKAAGVAVTEDGSSAASLGAGPTAVAKPKDEAFGGFHKGVEVAVRAEAGKGDEYVITVRLRSSNRVLDFGFSHTDPILGKEDLEKATAEEIEALLDEGYTIDAIQAQLEPDWVRG